MELSQIHDVSVLRFSGEVSLNQLQQIEQVLKRLTLLHTKKILIDMSEVDYVHYKVVYSIVENTIMHRFLDGDIKFVNLNGEARDVVRFVGAHQVIEEFCSVSEAIMSFDDELRTKKRMYH